MADEDQEQQQEQNAQAMKDIREAQKRAEKRATDEAAARLKSDNELAGLRAEIRGSDLSAVLKSIGAPEGLASVYPADGAVDETSVSAFVKDQLGVTLSPAANADQWDRVERIQNDSQPSGPATSELDKAFADGNKAMIDLVNNTNNPNLRNGGQEAVTAAFNEANRLQDEIEPAILSGREGSLVDPQGFGGLIDPPGWARTAKAYHGKA